MNLLETLTSQLNSGGNIEALSSQLGVPQDQAKSGVSAALPMLMGLLANKGADESGAAELASAAERETGLADNLGSFLSSSDNGSGPDLLKSILGGKQAAAESGISQLSGLDASSSGKLLENLAPVVMGFLGKQKQKDGLDNAGFASLLGQEKGHAEKQSGASSLLTSLLDRDGDGSVIDDVAGMASKFFK